MGRATDYSNCYIYYIVDKDGIVHYVGSTSNFNSRKSSHRHRCNTEHAKQHNVDIYKYIRANGGWDVFEMVPIHKIKNVSNATELRIAEQSEINKFSTLKNKLGSYLSPEKCAEQKRQWVINNPEKSAQIKRNWAKNNPEKLSQWAKNNPEKRSQIQRKYREANKAKINEKQRQYRLRQKELKSDQ